MLVASPKAAPVREPAVKLDQVVSLNFCPKPDEKIEALCRRLAVQLFEHNATPLHLQVFGHCRAYAATLDALRKIFGQVDWPLTWVEGAPCGSRPLAGFQMLAFTGGVERIAFGGRGAGSVFVDGGARQCLVGGLVPEDKTLSRPAQTKCILEKLQTILAAAGFDLADVVRTWFFLEDILAWYDDFNRARTSVYSGMKFRAGSLPASTGVGAKNPAGTALALSAWAFRPQIPDSYAEEVASPLQCPAPAYGSSFSRAMEISTNGGRRLFVSGTASIAPGGKTQWPGDVCKQVGLTMDVVEAILRSRGFALADISRATAYFRHPADFDALAEWIGAHRLFRLPLVSAQCDVCRDDLLFELEAEAASWSNDVIE